MLELNKTAMEESLKKFLKKNPAPSDEKFHAWAERKGIETDKAEAGAYRLAGKYVNLLTEGKSKGKSPEGITPEEKRVGVKIEAEHTDDLDLRKKIRNDHNFEHKRYYSHLPAFEKMLETEKKGEAMNPLMMGFVDELGKTAGAGTVAAGVAGAAAFGYSLAHSLGVPIGYLAGRFKGGPGKEDRAEYFKRPTVGRIAKDILVPGHMAFREGRQKTVLHEALKDLAKKD
jgi:hypothetical protein